MSMPFDFGFFPGTKAANGNPLDVLVLMDGPAYPGIVVSVRLLGVIEAEQSDDGRGPTATIGSSRWRTARPNAVSSAASATWTTRC